MRVKKNLSLQIGFVLVGSLTLLMLVSLMYTPYDPNQMFPDERLQGPSMQHLMGTDNFGRDILSRVMEGAQTAFLIGSLSVAIGLSFGLVLGSFSGYFGGWIDELIMRLIDAMMALPGILFAIVLVAVFSPSLTITIIAIGLMSIPSFTRIIRSSFVQAKEFDYVKASKAKGASHVRLMYHHILPNSLSPIIVAITLSFSSSVLAESGLSYLGLGVQPPFASWGRMLKEAQPFIAATPSYIIIVGGVITSMVLGFNLLSDGMRDANARK